MSGFSDSESMEEFKHRLNTLTEKLKKTTKSQTKHHKTKAGTHPS
jgi:hypothetical protein